MKWTDTELNLIEVFREEIDTYPLDRFLTHLYDCTLEQEIKERLALGLAYINKAKFIIGYSPKNGNAYIYILTSENIRIEIIRTYLYPSIDDLVENVAKDLSGVYLTGLGISKEIIDYFIKNSQVRVGRI